MSKTDLDKVIKINLSVSTNQRNDGKINTTSIMKEYVADEIIRDLESGDMHAHVEVFKYLYSIGYLEARVRKMYECDTEGNYKGGMKNE